MRHRIVDGEELRDEDLGVITIMGDVSQNINYETGMNDWEEMKEIFLTGPKDCFQSE